ncbi:amino ABC transporter, permease, 3-TM region, His/Glu/Gln/Arg/opine family domain protein, partial [Vibrio parahaemolyticus V-223/04]
MVLVVLGCIIVPTLGCIICGSGKRRLNYFLHQ